jgi:uncharacterized protein DUF4177
VSIRYKVVETSDVNDQTLEQILNEWTSQGWRFDTMQFAMRESSKRPSMAFLTFTRTDGESG